MKASEMKITIPRKTWNAKDFECRIDPNTFKGEWMMHNPSTENQERLMNIFRKAKSAGNLHAFTCMTIDPSYDSTKKTLIYQKGLQPATGIFSQKQWENVLKTYNPSRNSRQMTITEGVCFQMAIIQKLVNSKFIRIPDAWRMVCDDSIDLGHYRNSENAKNKLEPTGSREVCGFYDLGNTFKLLTNDVASKNVMKDYYCMGGCCHGYSANSPIALFYTNNCRDSVYDFGVGKLALD